MASTEMRDKVTVGYGGGRNSTAMLIGMQERGERVDLILFADTGGEKPETYEFIGYFSHWLKSNGFPEITIVKNDAPQTLKDGSLENECLRLGVLPSRVYGYGSCSMKWKREPQDKFFRRNGWNQSHRIHCIGMDAGEPHRAEKFTNTNLVAYRFPLIEWGWGRPECTEAIQRAGITPPLKSACFFCPSSKKWEVVELAKTHPDLFERAVEMERKALAGEGPAPALRAKGLGRAWSWKELVENYNHPPASQLGFVQCELFDVVGDQPCGCYDGGDE